MLERELLELAQQPLLAVADLRDERLGAGVVELDAELARAAPDSQRGSSRGLTALSSAIYAAGRLDRLAQRRGRP